MKPLTMARPDRGTRAHYALLDAMRRLRWRHHVDAQRGLARAAGAPARAEGEPALAPLHLDARRRGAPAAARAADLPGEQALDMLCVEGSDRPRARRHGHVRHLRGRPKKDVAPRWRAARSRGGRRHLRLLRRRGRRAEIEATGLQFHKRKPGGFLGEEFRSRAGLPVINLPGCPAHPEVVAETLAALVQGVPLALDALQTPAEWYGLTVHQGCTRNEYHEYRVEERDFGESGCLFFHLGCRGPLVHGRRATSSSGTAAPARPASACRASACTEPDFPQPAPVLRDRGTWWACRWTCSTGSTAPHYLAYKGMAAAAAPLRLSTRETVAGRTPWCARSRRRAAEPGRGGPGSPGGGARTASSS